MRVQPLIQLIDHEPQVLEMLAPVLEKVGWHVLHAGDGHQGQAMAMQHQPHLIVLDLLLPKLDGLSVLQRLRRDQRTARVPVMVLTALASKEDKLKAFNCGADDYVLKPFEVEEVFVRIRALLRHQLEAPLALVTSEILSYGPLTLRPEQLEVLWYGQRVRLTRKEFELLHCLLQRHGQAVPWGVILHEVWGYANDDDIECIRTQIRHIRTKIEPEPHRPRFLKTIYGMGYCLDLPQQQMLALA
ncbi:response regulator transcription factor [Synechococcus sp. CS-1333]|uniref:response regulator transcription factor n=1 Tax=Synechococcus sp. CS-1333 TaxID=2848638 RepID=UPI00223BBC71|nr:response regulator transcription factor [Synechococcus sp. CS-1333]